MNEVAEYLGIDPGAFALFWSFAPKLASVLVTLAIGWVAARALQRLTTEALDRSGVESAVEEAGGSKLLYHLGVHEGLAHAAGRLVFTVTMLVVAYVLSIQLGFEGISKVLDRVVSWLPRIGLALVTGTLGLLGADVVRRLIGKATARGDEDGTKELASRIVYWVMIALVLTLTLEQLGMDVGLIHTLIWLMSFAVLFSLGVTFVAGAQTVFKALIARHYVLNMCREGESVRLDDGEDYVVARFEPIALVLLDDAGRERSVLYTCLIERPWTLLDADPVT